MLHTQSGSRRSCSCIMFTGDNEGGLVTTVKPYNRIVVKVLPTKSNAKNPPNEENNEFC